MTGGADARRRSRPPRETLSAAEARRVALVAQGFGRARPATPAGRNRIADLVRRLGLLQIDSVNALVRAHYLPALSRLGAYPADHLDHLAYGRKPRRLFEYWGHEASLLPVELHPLLRWRMARAADGEGMYGELGRFARERRPFIEGVLAEVAGRGPLRAQDLSGGERGQGSWWGWSDGKRALECLFWAGRVTTAERRGFERVYDLPERVLPARVLDLPTPDPAEAQRELLRIAARACGIATEPDLRDYFRLPLADTRARLAELVEAGDLRPVRVTGWDGPAYLSAEAALPRRVAAQALLSPFDSLIWMRPRTERLFDFHYRLALYTPAHKRVHGYYVLPFLLGDRLVGRVDLRADRKAGTLKVLAAYGEPGVDRATVAVALAAELHMMRGWLGLEHLEIARRGDLAQALRSA